MAAPILWAPGIFGSFCWKTSFRGGVWGYCPYRIYPLYQDGKSYPGTSGTQHGGISPGQGVSQTKTLCKAPFSVVLDGMAGMSRDLGRDVPGSEKLYARKLWADFSFLTVSGKCRVLIFLRVWSFDSQALYILSADDSGRLSETAQKCFFYKEKKQKNCTDNQYLYGHGEIVRIPAP